MRNLNERVKPAELEQALRWAFESFGKILTIVIKRSLNRKGQAFIVFDNVDSAKEALKLDGFPLFDKPMQTAIARTHSDATVAKEGQAALDAHQRKRQAAKGMGDRCNTLYALIVLTKFHLERKQAEAAQNPQKLKRPAGAAPDTSARPLKAAKPAAGANAIIPDEYLPPNRILFVQNFPDEYDSEALSALFNRFEGFREVRVVPAVPGRAGMAFVEYEAEAGAISAKEQMANIPLGAEGKPLKVTFQRQ